MKNLELTTNDDIGISEAPVQMKSNCGTLVIDDFGRQQIAPAELLNRWIVPLEKRYDYLGLASGRKFCVPFDQFIVFSTNLEPKDLVDEAFLRRIPYKIEIDNPSFSQFRALFERTCQKMGLEFREAAFDKLIAKHYAEAHREMRFCHPRDLLHQAAIFCKFLKLLDIGFEAAPEIAAKNYFSTTGFWRPRGGDAFTRAFLFSFGGVCAPTRQFRLGEMGHFVFGAAECVAGLGTFWRIGLVGIKAERGS